MVGSALRELFSYGQFVRLIGVHDGLSAILAERAGFEAVWVSGLAVSSSHGVPDAGLLTMTEFHEAAVQVRRAVDLPIVADVDGGFGDANVIRRMVQLYEGAGIEAICIEDKQFPKRNSFRDGNQLEHADVFAYKIATAKGAQRGENFMVVARLESLIVGAGIEDALSRAKLYRDAGADALLIHSRDSDAREVAEFCARWRTTDASAPIFAVPTTYHRTTVGELATMGVNAAVYANQLIRANVAAMNQVLASLDTYGRSTQIEDQIASLGTLFDLTGTNNLIGDEPWAGLGTKTTGASQ